MNMISTRLTHRAAGFRATTIKASAAAFGATRSSAAAVSALVGDAAMRVARLGRTVPAATEGTETPQRVAGGGAIDSDEGDDGLDEQDWATARAARRAAAIEGNVVPGTARRHLESLLRECLDPPAER